MIVDRLGLAGIATAKMVDTTLAGANKAQVAAALDEARAAEDADLAIAVIGSSAQFRPQDAIAGVLATTGPRPIAAFLLPQADASLKLLSAAGIAAFRTPESCADAVSAFIAWQPPRVPPSQMDTHAAENLLPAPDEAAARAVFAALGIDNHASVIDPAHPPKLAYPVALKAVSANIAHKTEAGAVALNVADAAALRAAADDMRARLGTAVTGFIAQPMVRGVAEVILGYRRDPLVGPVVALGVGGVLAELYRDVTLRLAPVTEAEAMEMVAAVKGLAPARGYRNLPRGDLAALARAVARFSQLSGVAGISEAEINPLIVLRDGEGVVMADALIA